MICPEEWGDTFGEEFYEFSMENALYYSPKHTDLKLSEKSKPIEGQLSFDIMTRTEVLQMAENIRKKVGNEVE